ncbi:MAG: ubiquinone/menaquinone biosynthesis methyltransferase [Euryarchaeota archaeon]|nr:ubiquinone/menaquinone biosynthesis methyltransferase [Euryarchaeota archaeon]
MTGPADEKKEVRVRRMFERIAPTYDRANTILTFGRDAVWRRRAIRSLDLKPGERLIDIGCGTGRLLAEARRQQPAILLTGLDFAREMLRQAGDQGAGGYAQGDALRLPFRDSSFDAAVTAWVLRNVNDIDLFFCEATRVLKAGARIASVEIAKPTGAAARAVHSLYFDTIMPPIGGLISGEGWAYSYLSVSLKEFPSPEKIAASMRTAGFEDVRFRRMGGGAIVLHTGRKG